LPPPTAAPAATSTSPTTPPTLAPTAQLATPPTLQAASAAPVKTWVETKGFRKSEAKYFAATGRPQLVEFFAFW
jgi:hypothetical protein